MDTCPNCGTSLETTAAHNPALCRQIQFNSAPADSGIYHTSKLHDLAIAVTGREVVRLNADGTYWIAGDMTADEALKTIADLARYAAACHRKARECDLAHKA